MLWEVTSIKPGRFSLTRHAPPQNQERSGCSGETEGVRRHPSTLWQGDESWPVCSIVLAVFACMRCFAVHLSQCDLWVLVHRGSAWWFQLLLRLCVWSPLARWALNRYSTAVPIRFNLTMKMNLTLNWSFIDESYFSDLITESSCTFHLRICGRVLIWIKGCMWFRLPDQHWNVLPSRVSLLSLGVWHTKLAGSTRLSQPPWRRREKRRPSSAMPRKRRSENWPSRLRRTSRQRLQSTQTFWNNMESLSELVASGQ